MGTIVAIGGYHKQLSNGDPVFDTPIELIDKEIVRLRGKKKPNVLFVPTASSDSQKYVDVIQWVYEDQLGANFDALRLIAESPSEQEICSKIEWADVIYVGGGNTLKMMKKWRRLGVDKLLIKAYEQGAVMCGASAGSICWFEYGVSDSLHFYDETETKYIKVRGLGILPGVHCPHFKSTTEDNKHRYAGLKEVMKRSKGKCLAIPDGSAVVIQGSEMRCIGLENSSWCWWEKGKWREECVEVGASSLHCMGEVLA